MEAAPYDLHESLSEFRRMHGKLTTTLGLIP